MSAFETNDAYPNFWSDLLQVKLHSSTFEKSSEYTSLQDGKGKMTPGRTWLSLPNQFTAAAPGFRLAGTFRGSAS